MRIHYGSQAIELRVFGDQIQAKILGSNIVHTFAAVDHLVDYIGDGCIVKGFIDENRLLVIEDKIKKV